MCIRVHQLHHQRGCGKVQDRETQNDWLVHPLSEITRQVLIYVTGIGGEDILYAMMSLGFDNYAEALRIHLAKLRLVRPSNPNPPTPLQPMIVLDVLPNIIPICCTAAFTSNASSLDREI